mgnify:CR=1 FL=1
MKNKHESEEKIIPEKNINNLFRPLAGLNGVGSRLLLCLTNILPNVRIIDLLFHLPINTIDRSLTKNLDHISNGDIITAQITVKQYQPNFNRKSPFSVITTTKSHNIFLDFFHFKKDYLLNILPINSVRIVSGKCNIYNGNIHIIHPDHILKTKNFSNFLEPIYPLTKGLNNKFIRKLISQSLHNIDHINEWQDESYKKQQNFSDFHTSLINLHQPKNDQDYQYNSPYVRRLAYDEFLAMQISLHIIREKNNNINGYSIITNHKLIKEFLQKLPFQLTSAQQKTVKEILDDQATAKRMSRLIQGDVGCGKTIVAAIAMINAVASGYQVALMVPTAILAKQHFEFLESYFKKMNISTILFTGEIKGKKRKEILTNIVENKTQIIIGTHALFYDQIKFANLGLAVIDEQHRFGVKQRLKLIEKGYQCDFLLMSATPIPRTLTLAMYGDMDISTINEKPIDRQEIDTRILSLTKLDKIIAAIKRALKNNEKIYWICPLVDQSDILNLSAVEERYKQFKNIFSDFGDHIVAMVHGKMKQEKKDQILKDFLTGKSKLLLATTVVEVGINVPDATIMIIEHANKFGLAQLHQLRGRVGRGNKPGICLMLYSHELSTTSLERLKVMHNTNDGFLIAEKDLKIRGGGEIMGTKQSGLPTFRIANLKYHYDLLKASNKDAKLLLNKDPSLTSKRGRAIRILLKIFNYEQKVNI